MRSDKQIQYKGHIYKDPQHLEEEKPQDPSKTPLEEKPERAIIFILKDYQKEGWPEDIIPDQDRVKEGDVQKRIFEIVQEEEDASGKGISQEGADLWTMGKKEAVKEDIQEEERQFKSDNKN